MTTEAPAAVGSWPSPPGRVTPFCHGSSVLPLANGDVLAAWFGGTWEAKDDTGIYLARQTPAGEWLTPELIVPPRGLAHGNAVLAEGPEGKLYLFYFRSYGNWCADGRSYYRTSLDCGRTWGHEAALGGRGGLLVKNKPYTTPGGTMLLPVYDEVTWRCGVATRDEHGAWSIRVDIGRADLEVIQGAIVPHGGRLHMLMRSRSGHVCDSVSDDGGRQWSAPYPLGLPNPNSGLDAVALSDGALLLAHNPAREVIRDILDPAARDGRYPLVLSRSDDGGRTWRQVHVLEEGPGEFSYPAMALGPRGELHVTYTYLREGIRHVVFEQPSSLT